jgi:hypothetical protein
VSAALALFPTGHLLAGVIVCTVFVFADSWTARWPDPGQQRGVGRS